MYEQGRSDANNGQSVDEITPGSVPLGRPTTAELDNPEDGHRQAPAIVSPSRRPANFAIAKFRFRLLSYLVLI